MFYFFSCWWNRFEPIAFCVHIFQTFSLKGKKYTNEIVRSNAIIQIQITKSSRLSFVSIALLTVIPLTAHLRLVFCVHLVFFCSFFYILIDRTSLRKRWNTNSPILWTGKEEKRVESESFFYWLLLGISFLSMLKMDYLG